MAPYPNPEQCKVLPEAAVQFYDPNSRFEGNHAVLVDTMLRRPPARNLRGWDLVMAELQLAGIETSTRHEVAEQADMTEAEASRISEVVVHESSEIVERALSRVAKLRHLIGGGEDHNIVVSSAILSATSHRHDRRISGGAYYNHPKVVAKIIEAAWRLHMSQFPEQDLQLKQSLGLLHDAWENMFQKKSVSFLGDERVLVTPFSYGQLLGRIGVSIADIGHAVAGLQRVTKQPDVTGVPQDYVGYIENRAWKEISAAAKLADIHHNFTLDRKPVQVDAEKAKRLAAKHNLYRGAPLQIRSSVNTDNLDVALFLGGIGYVTQQKLDDTPSILDTLNRQDLEL